METALEELAVGLSVANAVHVVHAPHGPGMDRRIQIGEIPLVGRKLPVGVLELLEEEDFELVLGELGVNQGEGDAVERQVPRGKPRDIPIYRGPSSPASN